jgi:hypothetical protein
VKRLLSTLQLLEKDYPKLGEKSVGPDGIPGEILKLGGETVTPYLARLLEISVNNATISSDWKTTMVIPIYKWGDRSAVTSYRPISLTSVVWIQLEHVIAGYLWELWEKNDWLYEGQHRIRPGYSCESQVIRVCQDIADSLDKGVSTDVIITDFSKAFNLVPHDQLLTKLAALGMDSRVFIWVRNFLVDRTQRVGEQLSKEVKVTSGMPLLFLV